jgi:hypothetical protein
MESNDMTAAEVAVMAQEISAIRLQLLRLREEQRAAREAVHRLYDD